MTILRRHIKERFIYSWVISLILGIIFFCACVLLFHFAFQQMQKFNGMNIHEIGIWGCIQIIFWFGIDFFSFAGMLLFSMGLLFGLMEGVTVQMMLCDWGIWPEPKQLRGGDFPMDSRNEFF